VLRLNLMRGRIPLTQGQVAKVDDKGWEKLFKLRWFASWHKDVKSFYVGRKIGGRMLLLHRAVMGLEPGDRRQVDHLNHDTLDNRTVNLKVVTNRANHENLRRQSPCGAGIWRNPSHKSRPYRARALSNGKDCYIGSFTTLEEAQVARRAWLQERGQA